ncbi:MAG: hypothetical protein CMJ31_11535 [Phycisphaerae bacterium]|nr:hypothetical protein [Phycisphaerae bacterium]
MNREQERVIIEAAIAGDRTAAGDLIRHHQRSVYAYLLRMSGRPDVAEDMAQEAFVRVLTNLERFDFRYRFSTWLFTIARRLLLNHLQKMKPAYDTDAVFGAEGRGGDAPIGGALFNEQTTQRRSVIDVALQDLSADQREVVVLFHQLDWPIALIAQHLDMPEGTVKSHLHRGRRRLREALASRPELLSRLSLEEGTVEAFAAAQDSGVSRSGGARA